MSDQTKDPEQWGEKIHGNGWYYNLYEITERAARCGFVDVQNSLPKLRDPLVIMTK